MSTPAPAHHHRAQAHMTIENVLRRMRRDDHDLAARAASERPDGYPTGGQGGGARNGVSNPTLAAVERRLNEPDPKTGRRAPMHATRAIELTMRAAALLSQADSWRAKALPPALPEESDDWCTNCERAGELSPRGKAKDVPAESTLCTWCHQFQRDAGFLPPRSLVRKHARGDRISERDVQRASAAQKAG